MLYKKISKYNQENVHKVLKVKVLNAEKWLLNDYIFYQ